ncbi:MAG TPA: AbrB/MazE/SpoVT family DNA-binding domain-containing protein [Candidatus Saccharimonadales bacterium]
MNAIDTTLTTSGNSTAVRLPKEFLRMSGLTSKSRVRLEANNGKIIISKSINPRAGWSSQIKSLVESDGDPSDEFNDEMNATLTDGLDAIPWDGPTFEEWQKSK